MSLKDDIKKHEGWRSSVYKCTNGYDTIGYGFAIKDLILDKDIGDIILERKLNKLDLAITKTFSWFIDSPSEIKIVVTEMCYNLGVTGFSKFKKTIYLLETEQYEEASVEMLDSLWAKQVGNRANRLATQMRENK